MSVDDKPTPIDRVRTALTAFADGETPPTDEFVQDLLRGYVHQFEAIWKQIVTPWVVGNTLFDLSQPGEGDEPDDKEITADELTELMARLYLMVRSHGERELLVKYCTTWKPITSTEGKSVGELFQAEQARSFEDATKQLNVSLQIKQQ